MAAVPWPGRARAAQVWRCDVEAVARREREAKAGAGAVMARVVAGAPPSFSTRAQMHRKVTRLETEPCQARLQKNDQHSRSLGARLQAYGGVTKPGFNARMYN